MANSSNNISSTLMLLSASHKQINDKCIGTHLYKLEKDAMCFYLMGSNHTVSLNLFPSAVKKTIESICLNTTLFLMEGLFCPLTLDHMQKKGYFLGRYQTPFWDRLSQNERDALLPVITAIKNRHQLTFNVETLSIPGIHELLIQNLWESGMDAEIHLHYGSQKRVVSLSDVKESEEYENLSLSETNLAMSRVELKEVIDSFLMNAEHKKLLEAEVHRYFSGDALNLETEQQIQEVTEQNQVWFKKILDAVNQQNEGVFVAVGAAHLYNNFGLLSQFLDNNFRITRMNSDNQWVPAILPTRSETSRLQV